MRPFLSAPLVLVAAFAFLVACTPAPRGSGGASLSSPASRDVQPDTNPMEAGRPPSMGGQRAVTPVMTR